MGKKASNPPPTSLIEEGRTAEGLNDLYGHPDVSSPVQQAPEPPPAPPPKKSNDDKKK